MEIEAIFDKISERIQKEFMAAQKSINIVVLNFNNIEILTTLIEKSNTGCIVSILTSDQNDFFKTGFCKDIVAKARSSHFFLYYVNSESLNTNFCIIDYSTVITGSYKWSNLPDNFSESIIINYENPNLSDQFISRFNYFLDKRAFKNSFSSLNDLPLNKIITRLEIIKNYIALEDTEELDKEISKLKEYSFDSSILTILNHLEKKEYSLALNKIQTFSNENNTLSVWHDPAISSLKLELKNLEFQLNAYENEKFELEKLLLDFHRRHTVELGSIILEILKLRKLKFKFDPDKYEEAENDFNQFNEQFQSQKDIKYIELSENEKIELKKNFRKASFLCHPDKINEYFRESAQKVFIELKSAYESNNLPKVNEILKELESGNIFKSKSDTISEKDLLIADIEKLKIQIVKAIDEITDIKNSETYNLINEITDWNEYFLNTKEKLQLEFDNLKKEISET